MYTHTHLPHTQNYYIINRSGSGTVTHLAPELFQVRGCVHTRACVRVFVCYQRGGVSS